MANRTEWTGGNLNSGLTWTAAFVGTDLNSLAFNSSVLSSTATFQNGSTGLDQFMDISVECSVASPPQTIAAGAFFGIWLAMISAGGLIGDNRMTAGSQVAYTPAWPVLAPIALTAGATASSGTTLVGFATGILIPPQPFRLIFQNGCGFALASSGNAVSISTYNQQLNN